MSDQNDVMSAEQAGTLAPGTWVGDFSDNYWCLVDTHVGFPQRKIGRAHV